MRFFNYVMMASVLLLIGGGCIPQASAPTESDMTSEPPVLEHSMENVLFMGAVGDATAEYVEFEGTYELRASAVLPVPEDGYFYEGWIVRREPLSVVSTGELYVPKNDDKELVYENIYEMTEDQLDHLEYIITIEPDDGDPAPAEHVVDIVMQPVK